MSDAAPISEKRGCDRDSLDRCILIKASVSAVGNVVRDYFGLNVKQNCQISEYIELEIAVAKEIGRQRQIRASNPNKSLPNILYPLPFWRYLNHQWTVLLSWPDRDAIAFAIAALLETEAIAFESSRYASYNDFKVFCGEQLIERYQFGHECGTDDVEYHNICLENLNYSGILKNYNHYFESSAKEVTEAEIEAAFLSGVEARYNRGFLDSRLRHYGAYLPRLEETPYFYRYSGEEGDFQEWEERVERMDIAIAPGGWRYCDLAVPHRCRLSPPLHR